MRRGCAGPGSDRYSIDLQGRPAHGLREMDRLLAMPEPAPALQPTLASPAEQMFPTLTPAQMARIAAHGSRRALRPGEVLVEAGDPVVPFFAVEAGRIEIVRPSGAAETLVAVAGPGQFTGEATMLSGRRALNRLRGAG